MDFLGIFSKPILPDLTLNSLQGFQYHKRQRCRSTHLRHRAFASRHWI